tara:strand:+ start:420 stop:572 length:153 start_codon:yes stop_codon:yes gene_type:complete
MKNIQRLLSITFNAIGIAIFSALLYFGYVLVRGYMMVKDVMNEVGTEIIK